jgi:hypothetical protein
MKKIFILTDYKEHFGSKHNLLQKYFAEYDYETVFLNFAKVDFKENWKDKIVLYTSQEDHNYHYKSYIEDIIYGLELAGAIVIPKFKYLRANNNKVFMEILRDQLPLETAKTISSNHYGSLEELKNDINNIEFPVVLKTAAGAMSTGVSLANSKNELLKNAKNISRTKDIKNELWDLVRSIKHKGYIRESKYRSKFVIQNLIRNFTNDFKIIVYNNRFYFLYRDVRKDDFRASGSGKFYFKKEYPKGMLDFADKIFQSFDCPNISIDVCFDGENFHLIEFQFIYFGTTTIDKSEFYYKKKNNKFLLVKEKSILEKVYVESIVKYLEK